MPHEQSVERQQEYRDHDEGPDDHQLAGEAGRDPGCDRPAGDEYGQPHQSGQNPCDGFGELAFGEWLAHGSSNISAARTMAFGPIHHTTLVSNAAFIGM